MTIFRLVDFPVAIPTLSPAFAASSASVLTLCYVGGLYVSTTTRIGRAKSEEGKLLTKDDPVVVRSRLRAAGAATLVSLAATVTFIRRTAFGAQSTVFGFLAALRLVGFPLPVPSVLNSNVFPLQPSATLYGLHHVLPSVLIPVALTSILFLGPLTVSALDGALPGQRNAKPIGAAVREKLDNVWAVRNYVVGPLTEEVVFRGCIVALHALAGFNKTFLIFATPLYFGFAHLHHAYEGYVSGGRSRDAAKSSALKSIAQFTYTSVFGWYANFLLLRTNSLFAPFAAHVYCNIMGLPDPVDDAQRHPRYRSLIYATHIAGLAAFAVSLLPMTKPGLFGGSWYWSG